MKNASLQLFKWQFPLGAKTARITIVGYEKITVEDMDALIEISQQFKREVIRRDHQLSEAKALEYEI